MILQALTEYYRTLRASGKIAAPGWSLAKISFQIDLRDDGTIARIIDVRDIQTRGKKTVIVPKSVVLPAPVKRTVGIASNFLWDNSTYILGLDNKGKPQRALECFANCKSLHEKLLADVDSPEAEALQNFFQHWDPTADHPELEEYREEILSGANLMFFHDGYYLHEDPDIRDTWERYNGQDSDGPQGICLVTGEEGPIEAIHPSIKNVAGAQSSGAALVSFNAPAFCSYGKEQNYNAPTGKYAAFAYTAALNHLLSQRDTVFHMGDATVVCWAKGGQSVYQMLYQFALSGNASSAYTAEDMTQAVKSICEGNSVDFDETRLDPNMEFYILALSPNAARLSVRFFLRNSFCGFLRCIQAHQKRLEIVRPAFDPFEELPLWRLMGETVNQNSRDKSPSPGLAGATLHSILTDTPYPATLLNGVMLRITAEQEINRGRAAIIKAYYSKNTHPQVPEEVLTVSLNTDSTNVAYNLGRLFSLLEEIQEAANPGINTTIRDRYFNAASSTPSRVFPGLVDLAQKHLRKLNVGQRIYYEKRLQELEGKFAEEYPARLSLPMKGSFQLGFYHQTQKRFEKKED